MNAAPTAASAVPTAARPYLPSLSPYSRSQTSMHLPRLDAGEGGERKDGTIATFWSSGENWDGESKQNERFRDSFGFLGGPIFFFYFSFTKRQQPGGGSFFCAQ